MRHRRQACGGQALLEFGKGRERGGRVQGRGVERTQPGHEVGMLQVTVATVISVVRCV